MLSRELRTSDTWPDSPMHRACVSGADEGFRPGVRGRKTRDGVLCARRHRSLGPRRVPDGSQDRKPGVGGEDGRRGGMPIAESG